MAEVKLLATIWWAPGWPIEAILEPKQAPAAQPALDRTSVFLHRGKKGFVCFRGGLAYGSGLTKANILYFRKMNNKFKVGKVR